jgi:uncharacterized protein
MNPIEWFRDKGRQLVELKDTSHSIALGTAIGMFFGIMPLWGFKTLLALVICRLLRGNLLAAAIASTLHDAALPILPLLLRWEYDLGYWLLSQPHTLPPKLTLSDANPLVWLHWSTFLTVGRPLLVGSLIFSTPVAIATYYITLAVVTRKQGGQTASETPSMMLSHAAATPREPRKKRSTAVAISWLQSLKTEARASPSTVRFSHD